MSRKEVVKTKHCANLCCPPRTAIGNVASIAFPAFGAGVLLTVFLPSCVLVGVCAATAVAFGVVCLISD